VAEYDIFELISNEQIEILTSTTLKKSNSSSAPPQAQLSNALVTQTVISLTRAKVLMQGYAASSKHQSDFIRSNSHGRAISLKDARVEVKHSGLSI
jgi:hypothetical protein